MSPSPAARRDMLLLTAMLVTTILAAGALNWIVDPSGNRPGSRYAPVTRNAVDRESKLQLLEARDQPPRVLVLGSSSSLRLDPSAFVADEGDGFNAAMASSTPVEVELVERYVSRRWGDDAPHLVWGIDVHSVREAGVHPAIADHPAIRGSTTTSQRLASGLERLQDVFDLRVTWQSLRALARGPGERPDIADTYRDDGLLLDGRAGPGGLGIPEGAEQWRALEDTAGSFQRLDPTQLRAIEQVVESANARGDRPMLFLPPVRPARIDPASSTGPDRGSDEFWRAWRERRQELLQFLRELRSRHQVTVLDLSDIRAYGGEDGDFIDDVHPGDRNLAIVARELEAVDAVQ